MNEERFSPWEESEHNERKPLRDRAKSIMDFLRSSHEDEDDGSEEGARRKKGKSKRWRRFFRSLFGEANNNSKNQEDSPKKSPLISFEPIRVTESDPEIEKAGQDSLQSSHGTEKIAHNKAVDKELELPDLPAETDGSNQSAIAEAETQPQSTENREAHTTQKEEALGLLQIDHSDEVEQDKNEHSLHGGGGSGNKYDSLQTSTPELHTASPTAALLAIDYLNYRSRKKLEKRLEKRHDKQEQQLKGVNEQLMAQNEALAAQKAKIKEADTYIKQTANKENSQAPLARQEKPVPTNPESSHNNPKNFEANSRISAKHTPEKSIETTRYTSPSTSEKQAKEQREVTQKLEAKQATTLRELEEAVASKEELVRTYTEKAHERKNEVRDNPSLLKRATPVGAILQNSYASRSAGLSSVSADPSQVTPDGIYAAQDLQQSSKSDAAYLQTAVKRGFITGVIAVAVAATMLLLF